MLRLLSKRTRTSWSRSLGARLTRGAAVAHATTHKRTAGSHGLVRSRLLMTAAATAAIGVPTWALVASTTHSDSAFGTLFHSTTVAQPANCDAAANFVGSALVEDEVASHKSRRMLEVPNAEKQGKGDVASRSRGFQIVLRGVLHSCFLAVRVFGRVIWMTCVFAPLVWTLPAVLMVELSYRLARRLSLRDHSSTRLNHLWPLWHRLLVTCLQFAGPLAIKFGQWASTRPDVFSRSFCDALEILHSDVRSEKISASTLRRIHSAVRMQCSAVARRHGLRLGESDNDDEAFSDVFESIDCEPVGAGCIAQVHRAVLNTEKYCAGCDNVSHYLHRRSHQCAAPPATPVVLALKVRRPGVSSTLEADLALLNLGARVASWIPALRILQPQEAAKQLAAFVNVQSNLSEEALNLERFHHNFKDRDDVTFPRPLMYTPWLIVETMEKGHSISQCLRVLNTEEKHHVGATVIAAFLQMVLVDNFIHGDLHPGNMLVSYEDRRSAESPSDLHPKTLFTSVSQPQVVFLDTGLATRLEPVDMRNFIDLFTAVATANGQRAGNLMISRRSNGHLTKEARTAFTDGVTRIVADVNATSFKLAEVEIGSVLERMMELVQRYRVNLDPTFTSLVVSIILLEGVGRQLDPNTDIFAAALPILWRADPSVRSEITAAMGNAWVARQNKTIGEQG